MQNDKKPKNDNDQTHTEEGKDLGDLLESFEDKFEDKGDKRYGLVAHNYDLDFEQAIRLLARRVNKLSEGK